MHAGRLLEAVIRRLGNGRFIVARLPNEGAVRREGCDFYSGSLDRAGLVGGVMEEIADGGYKVHLGLSLTIREADHALAPEAFRAGRAGSARQRAMTPLGLPQGVSLDLDTTTATTRR